LSLSEAQIPLGSSRHASTRQVTFGLSSPRILAVSRRDVTSQVEFGLHWVTIILHYPASGCTGAVTSCHVVTLFTGGRHPVYKQWLLVFDPRFIF